MGSKNIIRFVLLGVILIIVTVAAIALFTPLLNWPFAIQDTNPSETTLVPPPQATAPAVTGQPLTPVEVEGNTSMNKLTLTEQQIQDRLESVVSAANRSADFNIKDLDIRLEQGKMLLSTSGTLMGIQADIQNLEVTFEGTKVYATGPVKAFGVSPTLTLEANVETVDGTPVVEVTRFRLGALPLTLLNLSEGKITEIINNNIKSRNIKLSQELDSIAIEDSKLVIYYR